jgi:hypothetical protein
MGDKGKKSVEKLSKQKAKKQDSKKPQAANSEVKK